MTPISSLFSRRLLALVLAGALGAGCAASTDDEVANTDPRADGGGGGAKPGDGSAGDVDNGDDSGAEADGGDEDAAVDSGQGEPDGGNGGSGGDPADADVPDQDADAPDANDAGPDVVNPGGPECGDGKLEGDEECDDGNVFDNDGCDANCMIETPPNYGTCPGREILLSGSGSEKRTAVFKGNTSLLTANYTATCSGATPGGKDAVFWVKSDIDGRLTARITQATFDEILYARTTCNATGSTSLLQCSAGSTAHGGEVVSFAAQKNLPYYLIVDSANTQNAGSFTLEIEVSPAVCGNGVIDYGEKCDDGNRDRGDGCDENCQLEATPSRNSCSPSPGGEALQLTGNPPSAKVKHGNVNLTSSYTAVSGTACYAAGGKDAVYYVMPAIDGRLVAKLKANYDASIYARSTSCASTTAASQLACSNSQPAGGEEVVSFAVSKQTPYWLIVDTQDGKDGLYDLEVTVHPAQCGNGVRDGNEECDGDDVPQGFLCDSDCTLWRPADDKCPGMPLTLTGPEGGPYWASRNGTTLNYFDDVVSSTCHAAAGATAPVNPTGLDASYLITPPADGQLRVVASSSAFDVVLHARATCSSPTTELSCVNAVSGKAGYEQLVLPAKKNVPITVFVDGYATNVGGAYTLDVELLAAHCGDGKLDGNEECDDGNLFDNDGCSSTCKLELVSGIGACPGHPLTLAPFGNGYVASITASTANLTNKYNTACSSQTFGPEAIFEVVSPIVGKLTATVQGDFNVAVYNHTACMPTTTPTCTNKSTGTGTEVHTVTLTSTTLKQYIYVDGITVGGGSSSGVFKLDVAITP